MKYYSYHSEASETDGEVTARPAGPTARECGAQLVDRVFASVRLRKTYHLIGGGTLAACSLILDTAEFALLCLCWLALFGIISKRLSTAALGLLMLASLTGSKITTFGSALVFVAGDGVATLVGTALGKRKLPWHNEKSIAGSLSFFLAASLTMMAALPVLLDRPPLHLLMLTVIPSLAGCLAEALPFTLVRDIRDGKPDDNLLILLSSGSTLHLLIKILGVGAIR